MKKKKKFLKEKIIKPSRLLTQLAVSSLSLYLGLLSYQGNNNVERKYSFFGVSFYGFGSLAWLSKIKTSDINIFASKLKAQQQIIKEKGHSPTNSNCLGSMWHNGSIMRSRYLTHDSIHMKKHSLDNFIKHLVYIEYKPTYEQWGNT